MPRRQEVADVWCGGAEGAWQGRAGRLGFGDLVWAGMGGGWVMDGHMWAHVGRVDG